MPARLGPHAPAVTTTRLFGIAIALGIGLLAIAGASLVSAQRGEPGEPPTAEAYQGCINNYTGVLRIIGAGEQCQGHELPIQIGGSAGDAALLERIEALEADNVAQAETIETLQQENLALQEQVPDCLSTEGVDAVFEGCNVHVRDGSESTDGDVNGLGNLIVGYNENDGSDARTGSHNLIVGEHHTYSSYGGFVAGRNNTISSDSASVSGGVDNVASGTGSTVSGGSSNTAIGQTSTIGGGFDRAAPGADDWRAGNLFQDW